MSTAEADDSEIGSRLAHLSSLLHETHPPSVLELSMSEAVTESALIRTFARETAWRQTIRDHLNGGGHYVGQSGFDRLWLAHEALERQARLAVGGITAAEWLVLTRVGARFGYRVGTVRGAAFRQSQQDGDLEALYSHPLSAAARQALFAIDSLQLAIKRIEVAWRRVAKGQALRIDTSRYEWTELRTSPRSNESIELFDRRRANQPPLLGATIGSVADIGGQQARKSVGSTPIFLSIEAEPYVDADDIAATLRTRDPYYLDFVSLDRLAPAWRPSIPLDRMRVEALRHLCTWVALDLTPDHKTNEPRLWARYGVLARNQERVHLVLDDLLRSLDYTDDELLLVRRHLVEWSSASLIPFGPNYVIDLPRLANALVDALARPTDGPDAAAWGRAAEAGIQAHIDRSAWRPTTPAHRSLIQKTIKSKLGNIITDIDAVACTPEAILLIDYKSYPSTEGTRRGFFRETRNRTTKLLHASKTWTDKVAAVERNRDILGRQIGDLPFLGLTVVPEVPYLPIGPATDFIRPGLRRVSSVAEFFAQLPN